MSYKLIKRLRERVGQYDAHAWHADIEIEAADALELLERQLSDLRAEVAGMNRCVELLAEWRDDANKFGCAHRGGFSNDVFCALNALDTTRSGK